MDSRAEVSDCADGTYEVRFNVPVTGEYAVHATLRHMHIAGSPFLLRVTSGAAHGPSCRLLAPATHSSDSYARGPLSPLSLPLPPMAAGSELSLIIEARDHGGGRITHGGEHLQAWLCRADTAGSGRTHADQSASPALTIDDLDDGYYALRCRACVAARYLLHARIGKSAEAVCGKPLELIIHAARAHAPSTTLYGVSLVNGVHAGEEAHFVCVSHDAHGNVCSHGGEPFGMRATPASGDVEAERLMACDLIDRGDGTYAGSFRACRVGGCLLEITLDGVPIGPPTTVPILPGPTHAANCVLTVDETAHARFTVGAPSSRSLFGSPGAAAPVAASAGAGLVMSYAAAQPSRASYALPRLSVPIGQSATFVMEARDAFGNPTLAGGDEWHVAVIGPTAAGCESTVIDRGDGSYHIHVACHVAGEYEFAISLARSDDVHRSHPPWPSILTTPSGVGRAEQVGPQVLDPVPHPQVCVHMAAGPLAVDCTLHWAPPPPPIQAGHMLQLAVRAVDRWGNALSAVGGAVAVLERQREEHELDEPVDWLRCDLMGAAADGPDATAFAGGNGPPAVVCTATTSAATDAPGGPLSVLSDGGSGGAEASKGGSEFRIRAYPTRAGVYLPIVTVAGSSFRPPDLAYAVHVHAGPPSAERSYARGGALVSAVAGRAARFSVYACDAYGNAVPEAADAVHVTVRRCSVPIAEAIIAAVDASGQLSLAAAAAAAPDDLTEAEVCVASVHADPEGRGCAIASFLPRQAGTHAIRVLIRGVELHGSPFLVGVSAGTICPKQCTARGEGLRAATAGRACMLEIFSHDAHGNVLSHGEGACFEAAMARADGTPIEVASRCLDRDDGSYRLIYTTFVAGVEMRLSILCRGMHVKGSPFWVAVAAGRAHASHCHVVGAGATYARLGPSLATFTVHCADLWRNRCARGGERISVRSSGPSHPIVSVMDADDGAYEVSARYGLSGVYTLDVCIARGERRLPVAGSPFTVYAGLQLAEQYLIRWCADAPRSLPALAAQPTVSRPWAQGGSLLAVARLGTWRHDREALLAHTMRAWKLCVGRRLLERMAAGAIPAGSPREATRRGTPLRKHGPPASTSSLARRHGTLHGRYAGAPGMRMAGGT